MKKKTLIFCITIFISLFFVPSHNAKSDQSPRQMPEEYLRIKKIVNRLARFNNLGDSPLLFKVIAGSYTAFLGTSNEEDAGKYQYYMVSIRLKKTMIKSQLSKSSKATYLAIGAHMLGLMELLRFHDQHLESQKTRREIHSWHLQSPTSLHTSLMHTYLMRRKNLASSRKSIRETRAKIIY